MKTTPELEAEIVRLHYAEHWPVGTIATQLEAHPDVVRRVLGLREPRAAPQIGGRLVYPDRAGRVRRPRCERASSTRTGRSSTTHWATTPSSSRRGSTTWFASAATGG